MQFGHEKGHKHAILLRWPNNDNFPMGSHPNLSVPTHICVQISVEEKRNKSLYHLFIWEMSYYI